MTKIEPTSPGIQLPEPSDSPRGNHADPDGLISRAGIKRDTRFVSRLTHGTLALVMAGGRGTRLMQLTSNCVKPAVAFGGKFRIIDFALSNCINSGIRRIGVLTQYSSHQLITPMQKGWGFLGPTQKTIQIETKLGSPQKTEFKVR